MLNKCRYCSYCGICSGGQKRIEQFGDCGNFSPDNNFATIELTRGFVAFVDADDYERLSKYKWFYKVGGNGGNGGNGYAARTENYYKNGRRTARTIRMHREITNCPDGMEVDHGDGDTLNNRKYNLSNVPKDVNLQNRRYDKISA